MDWAACVANDDSKAIAPALGNARNHHVEPDAFLLVPAGQPIIARRFNAGWPKSAKSRRDDRIRAPQISRPFRDLVKCRLYPSVETLGYFQRLLPEQSRVPHGEQLGFER